MKAHPKFCKPIRWLASAALVCVFGGRAAVLGAEAPSTNSAISWRVVSERPGNTFVQVIWTGNGFVAVGRTVQGNTLYGLVASSPSGLSWDEDSIPKAKKPFESVASNGNITVVVGDAGEIFSSTDLHKWTDCSLAETRKYGIVFWTGKQFLAMGDTGINATSPDGVKWTKGTPLGNFYFNHGVMNGGKIVVSARNGLYLSPDGTTFTLTKNGLDPMYDVAWGKDHYVAVGSAKNSLLTSADGVVWANHDSGVQGDLCGVAWTGNEFIAVGDKGVILTSADGGRWEQRYSESDADLASVASNGPVSVAVGAGIIVTTATPLPPVHYTQATLTPLKASASAAPSASPLDHWAVVDHTATHPYLQIAWVGKQFVATGWANVTTSTDGLTWKTYAVPGRGLDDIANNGTLYVVVGERGQISTSRDLQFWANHAVAVNDTLFGVFWNGRQFVALGGGGVIETSDDGANWNQEPPYSGENFRHGVWTGHEFLVASASGGVAASRNGLTWSKAGSKVTTTGVATNGNLSVAVADSDPVVFTSLDGDTWVEHKTGASEGCAAVAWTGNEFVGVGNHDTLISSPDGATWTAHPFEPTVNLTAVAAYNGTVILGTSKGAIYANKTLPQAPAPAIALLPVPSGATPQVVMKDSVLKAKIYYTTNGSDPTNQSLLYTRSFSPRQSGVIKARAYVAGLAPSDITTVNFKID